MSQGRKLTRAACLAGALAATGLLAAPGTASADGHEGFGSKITVSGGVDYVTQYVFRGIVQENEVGAIQPSLSVAVDLWEGEVAEGQAVSIGAHVDLWGSIHGANTPSVGAGGNAIYEWDYTIGVTFGLPYGLEADVSYVFLTAPAAGGEFAQEVLLTISYDDSELWKEAGIEDFALNPYIMFAFETVNGSDGLTGAGGDEGIYFEFGIEYSRDFMQDSDFPITGSIGTSVGLSVDDYYESVSPTTGLVGDETFGFWSIDLGVSTPLTSLIPTDYGTWSAHAGISFLVIGDGAEAIPAPAITDGSEDFVVVGTLGVGFEY